MAGTTPRRSLNGFDLDEIAHGVRQVESSGGTDGVPRHEPGFEARYGAKWLQEGDTAFRRQAIQQFGRQAVYASYGPYQVLYPVAVEFGFRGTPEQLAVPATNRLYFEKKLLHGYHQTGTLRGALLRYNGGGNLRYPDAVLRQVQRQRALKRNLRGVR